jgi:hypothetical protein
MKSIVEKLFAGDIVAARLEIEQHLEELANEKLDELKIALVLEVYGEGNVEVDFEDDEINEANVTKMGRTKLIRLRVRGGKVQRRKKVSAVAGMTMRGGKMVRMSSKERRNRKLSAMRSKFKRRAKMKLSITKRKRSLRKRQSLGL